MTSATASTEGVSMSPWIEAAFVKYGWVFIGLTVGFAAKYALLIKRGIPIRPSLIMADLLLLPMVALISYSIVTRMGADGEMAALLSALATVGGDRLIKLLTDRFFRQVESEIAQVAERVHGVVRQEVQAERSGAAIIGDTLSGRAPEEYEALKSRLAPRYADRGDHI